MILLFLQDIWHVYQDAERTWAERIVINKRVIWKENKINNFLREINLKVN